MTAHDPISSAPAAEEEIRQLADALTNDSVRWEGTFVGIAPAVEGEAAHMLLRKGETAIPALLSALDDPSRFVIAHVLLTLIAGMPYGTSPWNGLAIDLEPTGVVRVDPDQRRDLARRWKAWNGRRPSTGPLPL